MQIAESQAEAIARWDLESFARLLDERSTVQRAVEALDLEASASAAKLQRVAEIDRENIDRVTSMIEETRCNLDEVHRGRIALNGYGKPGAEPIQRGSLLDRMR